MSETWQWPGYVTIARQAAAALAAPNDPIVRAILAQWQCEQPNPTPWPPLHNNPGNLTRYIGNLDGEPHGLATTSPGAGLLYTYATPAIGAAAYARYLLGSSRYPVAIAAARRADAAGFLQHVCAAGYGTQVTCCLSLLSRVVLAPPPLDVTSWRCAYPHVNVRSGPTMAAGIVGTVLGGSIVDGPEVIGGPYVAAGRTYSGWIKLGATRYTPHAYYQQLP